MDEKIIKRTLLLISVLVVGLIQGAKAQDVGVKSNLLSDAFLNPNFGIEIGLKPKWSVDVSGQFNFWDLSHNRKWKHWAVQPEIRYWLCDRFQGHFFGAHLLGGIYNIGNINTDFKLFGNDFSKLKNNRYQGWFVGAGLAYGYTWALSRHWNLEAEIGIGYVYTEYDMFECDGCGRKIEKDKPYHYFGPTKAAINIMYVF